MRAMDRIIVAAAFAALTGICTGGPAHAQDYPGNPQIPGNPKPDIDYRAVDLVGREDAWAASVELRTIMRWSNDRPIVKN